MDVAPPPAVVGLRRGLEAASLLVLGICLATPGDWSETRTCVASLQKTLSGDSIALRDSRGFWFDPAFADFLAEVNRSTAPGATVAVLLPKRPDVYFYQALYQLAPRRIVDEQRENEAEYVAGFRARACTGPSRLVLGAGELCRR